MNKIALSVITVGLIISIGILVFNTTKNGTTKGAVQNSDIQDGIQYVTIAAKGGYSPQVSKAVAGIPTKLIVTTNGTYDCSASLVIRSIGFQKILAQTGREVIDIGTPQAGQSLQGVCGMGMYSFTISFI